MLDRQQYSSLSDFDRADIHRLKLDWQWDDGHAISDAALWSAPGVGDGLFL